MQTRSSRRVSRALVSGVISLIVVALLVTAYVFSRPEDGSGDKTRVTLLLGYIPSVQFANLYVAAERGYFADEGIDIRFEYGNEADGVERIASNDLQFGMISGEQVLLARGRQRPVVYVLEWYHRFPVGIVSLADKSITTPADLAGRIVGVPGPYGASYIGLRALLKAGGLEEEDLGELRSIGFAAPDSVCAGEVEAAVVYIANEPLTIAQQCAPVNVIEVSDYITLVANGLVTNEQTIRQKPELVRGMVRAIQRGLIDVIADPDAAFDLAIKNYVKDLPPDQYATQRQVLDNSVALWRSDDLGRTDPIAWASTQTILLEAGLLDQPLADLAACYNMDFLPQTAE